MEKQKCQAVCWSFNNPNKFRLRCDKLAKFMTPKYGALKARPVCGIHRNEVDKTHKRMGSGRKCQAL